MKIKKKYLTAGIVIILLIAGLVFARFFLTEEDSWIKNEKGIYVKHGNPASTPNYVLEQQEAITCALEKFNKFTEEKNSQCLGTCNDYAVDIVHVPRTSEDNNAENQCADYISGKISHFIELDKNGEIVRIA